MSEWKSRILKLPFDRKPYKAYIVFSEGAFSEKIGDFSDEDEAIKAAETAAEDRNNGIKGD